MLHRGVNAYGYLSSAFVIHTYLLSAYADADNKNYCPKVANIYFLYFYIYFTHECIIFRQFKFFIL
jgi:hypothetical protein